MEYIATLEEAVGRKAKKKFLPLQMGDVVATHADTQLLREATGFAPGTPIRDGIRKFVDWYRQYYL
jgi:UDP-glucuronate 4-epimerase